MAKVVSEDQDYISYFEINAGKPVELNVGSQSEGWQFYSMKLGHGGRELSYTSPCEEKQDYDGFIGKVDKVADGYLLCRNPRDEVKGLAELLIRFLDKKLPRVVFEPLEPSFELTVERQSADEIRLSVFIDEGNVLTTIARWDGLGLRFFTNESNLRRFIDDLERDFAW